MTGRRSLIQKLGASVAGAGLVTGSAVAGPDSNQSAGEQIPVDGQNDTPTAERDFITGASSSFSQYTITTEETTILEGRWDFQTIPPVPGGPYQIDILVNADHVNKPTIEATDVETENIHGGWDYKNSSPVGPAYHWQARPMVIDFMRNSRMVDAKISPDEGGDVEVQTGTYGPGWPFEKWGSTILTVENE